MHYKDNNRILARHTVLAGLLTTSIVLCGACSKHSSGSAGTGRSYRMGFMSSAPRPDFNLYIQSLDLWTTLWVYIDPANGLDRASDALPLVARGRSISEPAIQQVYRRFVVVMDSILHPDHLGLALETNLIHLAAPASIYQGVRTAANAAATDVRAIDPHVPLSISVQAEVAWGKLNGSGAFVGVTQDFTDFPFLQELGISSYPYLSFSTPAAIPVNYYSQLVVGHVMPVFVSAGGWTSQNFTVNGSSIIGSPAQQAAYIQRQGQLLAQAQGIGLFQLTFTDLDLAAWPAADSAGLVPFAFLGVVDSNFAPKPALAAWDSLKAKPLN